MRTRDAGPRFEEVLTAIRSQTLRDYEVVVVDSGSRDETVSSAASFGARVIHLEPERFSHALSMNMGFSACRGALVVSLSQDATPSHPGWLDGLVSAMESSDLAAVFGRQIPRPGCFFVERAELARAYPGDTVAPRTLFSNVNSISRRALWERHPFNEALEIAEDQDWVLWAISEGYRVGYSPEASVYHSHEYSVGGFYRRCFQEAKAMASFRGYRPGIETILVGWPKQVLLDFVPLLRNGEVGSWPRVCLFRLAQLLASYRGARHDQ